MRRRRTFFGQTNWLVILAVGLAVSAPLADSLARAQAPLKVIAVSGEVVPGGNGSFSAFGAPVLNNSGRAAFLADLVGTSGGAADNGGLFSGSGGAVSQLAREGQQVVDGQAPRITGFLGGPALNDVGGAAMTVALTTVRDGIFRGSGGVLTEIAREGTPALFDGTFSNLDLPANFNVYGNAAFLGRLTGTQGGTTDDAAIYRGDGLLPLRQIAREGQPAPPEVGGFLRDLQLVSPVINVHGYVAFSSTISPTVGGSATTSAVFLGNGGELITASLGSGPVALNDNFQVAFPGSVGGESGIVRALGGLPTLIFREGQQVPGGNSIISDFSFPFPLNNLGQVAFQASLTGTPDLPLGNNGFYRAGDGPLVQVARAGQTAPDGNGRFSDLLGTPLLNDKGHVAFAANLTDATAGTGRGLFLYADGPGLIQVARAGQPMLGSTLTGIQLAGGSNSGSERSALNDLGQIAFRFGLADGRTGIAVASPSTGLAIDGLFLVAYKTPSATGPLIPGFDPLPETITATFRLDDLLPGQTSVGLDQVLTFEIDLPGGGAITRDDLDDFQLTLDDSGEPTNLIWSVGEYVSEFGAIIIANNNFTLSISGVDSGSETEFAYNWSESTNELAAVAPPLGCDFNADGQVNGDDLALWRANFGDSGAANFGDGDGDGDVDGNDFLCWQRELGVASAVSATTAVPEPSVVLLGLLACLGGLTRRTIPSPENLTRPVCQRAR